MSMSNVMEANMRQSCFFKNFGKGMADYSWVKSFTTETGEYKVAIRQRLPQ